MKVTISHETSTSGLRDVEAGDFFRFANGKHTDLVFLAMSDHTQGHLRWWLCKNMNTGELKKLYLTNTRRVIMFVEPLEATFNDCAPPNNRGGVEEDFEAPPVEETAP